MRIKIRTKIFLGFGFMVIVLLIIGIYGNVMITKVNQRSSEITNFWMPRVKSVDRIRSMVSEYRRWELTYLLSEDAVDKGDAKKQVEAIKELIQKECDIYEKSIISDEERIIFNRFKAQWSYYKGIYGTVLATEKDNSSPTLKLVGGEVEMIYNNLYAMLDTLVKLSEDGAARAKEESEYINASTRTNSVIAILVGLLAAIIGSYLLASYVAKPARMLLTAARGMTEGDLRTKVDEKSGDEMGELAGAFNEMSQKLRIIIGQISEGSGSLAACSQELSASGQEVSASVEEMTSTTSELAALSEMSASGAREAAGKATKALAAADHGMKLARDTEGAMKIIHDASCNALSSVRQLSEMSSKIGSITDLITSVAEQTNLLALNAAIEAARAGDQGRGFAVVADEVRSLAEQSEKAARDIAALVSRVQEETKNAVKAMDSVGTDISGGVKVVNDTGRQFKEIIDQVRDTVENVSEVVERSVRSSDGVREFADTTRQISTIVQQVSLSSQDLARMSEDLQKQVEQFKM